jgi:cell division septum initiation protein DivIVA
MAEPTGTLQSTSAGFQEENAKLRNENSILKADLGYWKKRLYPNFPTANREKSAENTKESEESSCAGSIQFLIEDLA